MTDAALNSCLEHLPKHWLTEGIKIVNHLKLVRRHEDEFVANLVDSTVK